MGCGRGAILTVAGLLALALSLASAAPKADDLTTAAAAAATTAATPTNPTANRADANSGPHYRLPMTAIPLSYTVALKMGALNTDTFSGTVEISVVTIRAVSSLTLHMDPKALKVDETNNKPTVDGRPVSSYETNEQLQTLTLTLSSQLAAGKETTIKIWFSGTLRKDMNGFYRSTFKVTSGGSERTVNLAATQFEPTHARSAFPCWDEPHYKATFTLSIEHDQSQKALANTLPKSDNPEIIDASKNVVKTTFKPTPVMSTYLVAFVVSDEAFESPAPLSTTTASPSNPSTSMPYSVLVRPGQSEQARYASEVGPKSLARLSSYTAIPYSGMGLGKMNLIAIPDFSAGAMENWGLVTFRETGLMYVDGESTESAKESIALVISHEQAHMWFGDLVSPQWWGYVWLNEGFARYMQYVAMDEVQPEWKLMDKFVVQTLQGALAYDALASSHPMSATVYTPNEIQSIFDRISYDKGASVLHMTRNVLGFDNFKTAIQSYLKEMQFYVAAPHDLFRAFDTVSANAVFPLPTDVSVSTVLKTWTEEAGYPVVTLNKLANGTIVVTQSRFASTESEASKADTTRWWVPLTYVQDGDNFDSPKKMWLDPSAASTSIAGEGKKWIVANIKQTGFYRVNYDEANWEAVAELLRSDGGVDKVPLLSRAALLDDALSLARAGQLRYATALDLTRYLDAEKEAMPWTAALPHLAFVHKALAGNNAQNKFKEYILEQLDAAYREVGFQEAETDTDANHQRLIFRSTLLGYACRLGQESCVNNATAVFKTFRNGGDKVKPSQRSTVYCTGLRAGDASDWEWMWSRYTDASTSPGERSLILAALGCTTDTTKLETFLGYSLDATKVRAQDAQAVFSAVLGGNDGNLDIAFKFFQEKLTDMSSKYGGWSSMQKVVEGLAGKMFDEEKVQQLERVLSANSGALGVTQAAAARSLETARANLEWRSRHLADVVTWTTGAAVASAACPLGLALALLATLLLQRSS